MVFRRGTAGLSRLQNRVLVPMSIFDIIGSIGFGFSSTLIPRGSNCTYGAIGNQSTCTLQGLMISLGLIVPFYNAVLCVYYLLVIKYNIRDHVIAKYERYMHIASILPPLVISAVAASASLFNNYALMCWLSEKHRYEINRDSIINADPLLSAITILVMILAISVVSVIIYCMVNLYKFVQEREVRMNTYRFPRPDTSNSNGGRRSSNLSNVVDDTKKQAFLYVGSFFLTYFFTTIMVVFDMFFDTPLPYPFMLLQGIFGPLQGFWNFVVFIRPRFNLVSRENQEKSYLQRLYITVFRNQRSQVPARTALRTQQNRGLRERWRRRKKKTKKKSSTQSSKNKQNHPKHSLALSGEPSDSGISGHLDLGIEDDLEMQLSTDRFRDNISRDGSSKDQDNKDDSFTSDGPVTSRPTDLRDFREHISLSLLIAEDILPPSLDHDCGRRRKSMIDFFRGDTEVETSEVLLGREDLSAKKSSPEEDNHPENLFNLPNVNRTHRRHSCPNFISTQVDFVEQFSNEL